MRLHFYGLQIEFVFSISKKVASFASWVHRKVSMRIKSLTQKKTGSYTPKKVRPLKDISITVTSFNIDRKNTRQEPGSKIHHRENQVIWTEVTKSRCRFSGFQLTYDDLWMSMMNKVLSLSKLRMAYCRQHQCQPTTDVSCDYKSRKDRIKMKTLRKSMRNSVAG